MADWDVSPQQLADVPEDFKEKAYRVCVRCKAKTDWYQSWHVHAKKIDKEQRFFQNITDEGTTPIASRYEEVLYLTVTPWHLEMLRNRQVALPPCVDSEGRRL